MKTLKQLFSFILASALAVSCFVSCSSDNTTDNPQALAFNIQYSTGGNVWSEVDPQELVLNKIGKGVTGTKPYLIVTSSAYWTVSVDEDCDWMTVTPLGGPLPAETTTNVYLYLTENNEYQRTANVRFRFATGKEYIVPIRQYGKLDSSESLLTFVKDSFGSGATIKDDVIIKFYNDYDGVGVATAGDPDGYAYSYGGSDNCFISVKDPSHDYEDIESGYMSTTAEPLMSASGGANVVIKGEGFFNVRNFNDQDKTNFRIAFGAKNSDGMFRTSDLTLHISCDNTNWSDPMPYKHYESEVNDWTLNTYEFSIAPNVSQMLFFKIQNNSTDDYRIDDLYVRELDHDAEDLYPLIVIGSDILGLPVNWAFNDLKQGNVKGDNWEAFGMVLSQESGVYEDESEIEFSDAQYTNAHVQFICGTDASLVKQRTAHDGLLVTSSSPKVTGMYEGDYWLFTLPVHKVSANTQVGVNVTFMGTDAGAKYMFWDWAQCTQDDYKLYGKNLMVMTDTQKNEFYNTLDWQTWKPVTIDVPNSVDKSSSSSGIPIGSASSPSGYFKGSITYSEGFAGGVSSFQCTTDPEKIICTFPDAMEDGYFFFRLRCAANLTCGPTNSTAYQRINKPTHNGTNYLRQTATFNFVRCGEPQEYANVYKTLFLVNNITDESEYKGGNIQFSNKATAGLYAGTTPNILTTTSGNNIFTGSCEKNESGSRTYSYAPYDASNGEDVTNVSVECPRDQKIADGYLMGDSAPFIQVNTPSFKTTTTMRFNMDIQSAILNLRIHANDIMAEKLSKVVLLSNTDIAGSYYFNLDQQERTSPNILSKTVTATAPISLAVSTDYIHPNDIYTCVWEGVHDITVRVYVGAYYYESTISDEFTKAKVNSYEINLSDCKKVLDEEAEITGISSAQMFMDCLNDIKAGKTGEDLNKYRNIDGDLGFGNNDSMVIDFAGIDMTYWPQVTLTENFNGGGFRIANLVIDEPNISLFKNIQYGKTVSNFSFDESCKLIANVNQKEAATWALLVNCGTVSLTGGVATGNIENVKSYATIEIFGEHSYSDAMYVAPIAGQVSGATSDDQTPSEIRNCQNYGRIWFHDITQETLSSQPYYRYTTVGGIIGRAAGIILKNCQNYGDIVFERVNRKCGTFYVAGLVGYGTNRADNTSAILLGDVTTSQNHGNIIIGSEAEPLKTHTATICGCVGRTQWCNTTQLENYGNISGYIIQSDPFVGGLDVPTPSSASYYKTWEEQLTGTTNTIDFISVGGILGFSQCNITTGCENVNSTNYGNITLDVSSPGSMTAGDNCGIGVGGVMGLMGANAYNPHFNGCGNRGKIYVTGRNICSEVCVGGVQGKFASNRYTANYVFTMNGAYNQGDVEFYTDDPENVVAHVGGLMGSAIYGEMRSNIVLCNVKNNATGTKVCPSNKFTVEYTNTSSTGIVLGTQHISSIATACTLDDILIIEAASVGGSVNGTTITPDNFNDFIYGACQHEKGVTVKDCSYFNN